VFKADWSMTARRLFPPTSTQPVAVVGKLIHDGPNCLVRSSVAYTFVKPPSGVFSFHRF
jgi:hypothetical protein